MIKTFVVFLVFGMVMISTLVLFIPYFILWLLRLKDLKKKYIYVITTAWARFVIRLTGSRVIVKGLENVPETDAICIISNHQGMLDILLVIAYFPKIVGFIAKSELNRIPIFSFWMKVIHCIFITRDNRNKTIQAIEKGVNNIKNGNPMLIFPEGTRGISPTMGPFKPGSLNLATRAQAIISPVTVQNSYKVFEEKKRIQSVTLYMQIHPPVDLSRSEKIDKNKLATDLWQIINSGLELSKKNP